MDYSREETEEEGKGTVRAPKVGEQLNGDCWCCRLTCDVCPATMLSN